MLDSACVPREARHIHLDAALAAIPLAVHPQWRRWVQLGPHGAHSVSSSTHKWPGSPVPGGVLIADQQHIDALRQAVPYIGSHTATLTCSRSGLAPAALWLSLHRHGSRGHHLRAEHCRRVAGAVTAQLVDGEWLRGGTRTR